MARSRVEASSAGPGVAVPLGYQLERGPEGEELAQRVPAQVVLLEELLDVAGRRPAGSGLEQPASGHQRHDRLHLRARAQLEDREQVGQVVAQDVSGDRDRVLAPPGALEREAGGVGHVHHLDLEP